MNYKINHEQVKRTLLLGFSITLAAGAIGSSSLDKVYAQTSNVRTATITAASSADVVRTFESYIKQPSKLAAARQYLIKNIGKVNPAKATVMVLHLENAQKSQLNAVSESFYSEHIQKVLDTAYRSKKDLSYSRLLGLIKDSKTRSFLLKARDQGYKLATGEGMYYLTMDYEGFKPFRSYVTKDIAAYIDLMALETNKPALSDAAIAISWDELIKRSLVMEAFLKKYPGSNRAKAVALTYQGLKFNIFRGSSNTPAYKENSKHELTTLLPHVRKAYEAAVEQGVKDSKLLASIKQVLKLLESSDGKWSKELDRYLQKLLG